MLQKRAKNAKTEATCDRIPNGSGCSLVKVVERIVLRRKASQILKLAFRCARLLSMALLFAAVTAKACFAEPSANYMTYCARCHNANGTDDSPPLPSMRVAHSFTDCRWMKLMSDATLYGIIKNGGRWAGMKDMPAFGARLTDEQIADIVAFIRSFCAEDQTD